MCAVQISARDTLPGTLIEGAAWDASGGDTEQLELAAGVRREADVVAGTGDGGDANWPATI